MGIFYVSYFRDFQTMGFGSSRRQSLSSYNRFRLSTRCVQSHCHSYYDKMHISRNNLHDFHNNSFLVVVGGGELDQDALKNKFISKQ